MSAPSPRRWPVLLAAATAALLLGVVAVRDTGPLTQQERIESISRRVACPTCQGESIAASRATAAEAIRAEIARQVATGQRTDDEIIGFIESRFGASVLLLPRSTGLDSLVWILPVAVLVVAAAALAAALARWRRTALPVAEDDPGVESAAPPRPPVARRLAVAVATVALAAGGGWFVAAQSGQRLPGQSATGGIEESTATLLSQARSLNFSDPKASVDLYGRVLEVDPDNVEALTYRAWILVLAAREASDEVKLAAFAAADGQLRRAIELDPGYPDARCFLGVLLFRYAGDARAAKEQLDTCASMDPPAVVQGIVEGLRGEVEAALEEG
ncbi:MAG: cytochrome c-type biogenesis protein CcmH [Acidobacteria bacterium]|nr:cytochrome c-type biogenesis protein CcmH [Acidobacteriota bacterium]